MNLARHSITSANPVHILDARFDADARIFTASTQEGFAVYRSWPLELVRKRELTNGTLSHVLPLHTTNLLFLVGGGRSPLYPPNKVVIWDDALGKEVAELEFKSQVRGLGCRRGWLTVALRRRVIVFQIGNGVKRYAEWETCDNPKGLLALATAPKSTLLAIPGRQMGHVQLIHLPPCPVPVSRNPPPNTTPVQVKSASTSISAAATAIPSALKHTASVVITHNTALTSLSLPPSGRLFATTSARGTLVRIWDVASGKLVKELRRGTDKAEIYGVAFRPDEKEVCVWSDKGTVHVFSLGISGASNRQSTFSPLTPFLPLPKYFESEWSYAQYRIPVQSSHISLSSTRPAVSSSSLSSAPVSKDVDTQDEEKCVVGWVQVATEDTESGTKSGGVIEWQLVALTYLGGWYRLALPRNGKDRGQRGGVGTGTGTGRESPVPGVSGGGGRQAGTGSMAYGSPPKATSRKGSSSSTVRGLEKGKERDREREKREKDKEKEKEGRECVLQEYRRFGRWDGWG